MLFEEREDVRHVVFALAGTTLRLGGRDQFQHDEIRDGRHPQPHAVAEVDGAGVLDRVELSPSSSAENCTAVRCFRGPGPGARQLSLWS